MDLNKTNADMIAFLTDAASGPSEILFGHSPFGDDLIVKDATYDALIEGSTDENDFTFQLLSMTYTSIVLLLQIVVADHLQSGQYHEPSSSLFCYGTQQNC
jgi:hypothetical protein